MHPTPRDRQGRERGPVCRARRRARAVPRALYLLLRNGLSTEADITSPDCSCSRPLQWGNVAELFSDPGQDQSSWTVQIALSTFLTAQTSNLHQLFLAAAISILPLVVMFVFRQRWIVEGVERSGINE